MMELNLKTKNQLLNKIKEKYQQVRKQDKSSIIEHLIDLTGYNRKYAIHKLNKEMQSVERKKRIVMYKKYNDELKEKLIKIWKASNKICSKRLVPFLPEIIPVLERGKHIKLTEKQKTLLCEISPASVDRLLKDTKVLMKKRKRSIGCTNSFLKHTIKIKTFNSENDTDEPGYFEADLVSHCGGNSSGCFLHTLVITDMHSQWTEFFPIRRKDAEEIITALIKAREQIPFKILGLNTDNGSEFINTALLSFCQNNAIKFTRSRAYKKNDQAHVEEKNGSIIRRMVGYDRFEGVNAENLLTELYQALRLYVNYFQPSLKLKFKKRDGARIVKNYDEAKTPYRRVMNANVSDEIKNNISKEYAKLDPVVLLSKLKQIQGKFYECVVAIQRQDQKEYTNLVDGIKKDISEFKNKILVEKNGNIPELQVCPTIKKKTKIERNWTTREDPFKDVWPEVQSELEANNVCAIKIMNNLILKYPDKFHIGHVRTLQRRIVNWKAENRKKRECVSTPKRRVFSSLIKNLFKVGA